MSQNDFTIANQGFPAFRADLNSALQALASNSSGATAPSTTFANMWWYDSANNIMYIRNEDNDAWIKFAELDQVNDKFVLSGTLQLDDGTVSAPALTFNSDTNMGIYRGGTDILKFVTAGTDAITIDASQGVTLAGNLDVSSGTIKLDGNYPVGSGNVALGNTALDSISGANNNVAIGNQSLTTNTSGSSLTAIGGASLYSNTTASNNVAIGFNAGYSITTGANNSVLGTYALDANSTGADNTAIGYLSLSTNTTGSNNVAVGRDSLISNTTGATNVAIGEGALYSNTTASDNTALGRRALYTNTTGASLVAVGETALISNTTGNYNTAVGRQALQANTTASNNTAVGYQALYSNTTGQLGTAVGYQALYSNNADTYCTALGARTLYNNTSGFENVAVGDLCLNSNTTGNYNIGLGNRAGQSVTTGQQNTIIGYGAGDLTTTGDNNIFIGHDAGNVNTTGLSNIIIGVGADVDRVNSSYAYVIGTDCVSTGTGGHITIGSGNGSNRIYNDFDVNASWTRISDERYKKEITDNTDCGLAFINDLRPVTFKWKALSDIDPTLPDYDPNKTTVDYTEKMYGLIAQEVKQALDNHNITDFGGHNIIEDSGIKAISQEMFIHPLIKAVQELSAKNDALEARIATLEGA